MVGERTYVTRVLADDEARPLLHFLRHDERSEGGNVGKCNARQSTFCNSIKPDGENWMVLNQRWCAVLALGLCASGIKRSAEFSRPTTAGSFNSLRPSATARHACIMSCYAIHGGRKGVRLLNANFQITFASSTSRCSIPLQSRNDIDIRFGFFASRTAPRYIATFPCGHTLQHSPSLGSSNLSCVGLRHIRSQNHRSNNDPLVTYHSSLRSGWLGVRRFASDTKSQTQSVRPESDPATKASVEGDGKTLAKTPTAGASLASKRILNRLPHIPYIHRPTKEELLAAATGFWHRLQIRFKWFSIRSARPFNSEEILTFISWIFWGHVLWVVIGTTTFVSLAILAINTVFAQETLATIVGSYLTRSIGVKIVFENAIVPNWRDGVITFKNVFISRRPLVEGRRNSIEKGSSADAAAEAALAERARQQELEGADHIDDEMSKCEAFAGVIDRTHVKPRREQVDPRTFRREHKVGDFEIDGFKLDDVLLTIYQPNNFRPFQVSVFNCELPRLRKQWLFYDILSANNISGSLDNSLFTIHPRQVHNYSGLPLLNGEDQEPSQWKKHSRLRIDGLKVDHLNRGVDGPFSWIYEGNVDIVADIMIPSDDEGSIAKVMSDFYDRMEATVTNAQAHHAHATVSTSHIDNQHGSLHNLQQTSPSKVEVQDNIPDEVVENTTEQNEDENRFLILDLNIQLNDVRASVPIFNKELSYVNNALVRPIVAYINSHSHSSRGSTFIPINCRIVKRRSEFDGSWTIFDSGLMGDVSREVYTAFVRDISDRKHRQRRIKKVGLWAAQVAAQALFIGLAGQLA
ncbi:hypothetical protein MRB53_039712 [Persea americana]|nr:hypothetical protein MRB53_039712 [Persea americana]